MTPSPPLRFLVLLLAGWTALRTAFLAPGWWALPAGAGAVPQRTGAPPPDVGPAERSPRAAAVPLQPYRGFRSGRLSADPAPRRPLAAAAHPAVLAFAAPATPRDEVGRASVEASGPVSAAAPPSPPAAAVPRLSVSAWAFLRGGDSPSLAPGGLLGGSQTGARLAFRLNRDAARPLALAVRLTAPLSRRPGSEAALGLDWRPSWRLPLHLVAERRQALGRDGRSAFAVFAHGGLADAPLGRLRLDGYAQAGIVGARSRDLFGDGALRVSLPVGGRIRLGAGAWAAGQPGAARLDAGPQASLRLPLNGRNVAVAADWRLRLAGDARPGSGPSLTLATDF